MNSNFKGVIIDPGHGGVDSGAIGKNSLEKDYTLLISKYMYDRFKELGIPVYITRDNDVTLNPNDRVEKILSFLGNDPNVIVISNHLNAGGGTGTEVIYALRNSSKLANMILDNIGNTGQNKRRIYQRRLPSNNSKDYYFIHRNTGKTEPVIVEYGFIDNVKDNEFFKNNYKKLAEAVIKSVLEYKNIPYKEPNTIISDTYTVISGDTLYSIANKLDTSISELKKINNLSSDILSIGQVLKVPTKVIDLGDTDIYEVVPGDTLYSIANRYGITIRELKELNNLTSDILSIGMLLNVPSGLSSVSTYTVTSGDTLYGIAKKFNVTVDDLKNVNNLTSNMLSIGQKLIIPTIVDTTYVVKKGDTLYGIAKDNNISVDKIKKLNNLTSNELSIGQILIVKEV